MKTIFINSHPIQYFAPLYRYLNENGVPTECWYCSDENVKGHLDRQFGTQVEWDIPILQGYTYRFFRNYSWKPSLYNGFFGLVNLGMVRALFKEKKSSIIIHGWSYLSYVLVAIFARAAGHKVCLRGENPLNQEMLKSRWLRGLKWIVFQGFLFRFPHYFLYIGSQNKAFYQYYGVRDYRLRFTPYAVDNKRFQHAATELIPQRKAIKQELGISTESKVILFAAKFIDKKRPMDILQAFAGLDIAGKCLILVGDGELRPQLEHYIKEEILQHVYLPGFVNQSEIVRYYSIADVFVLCSGPGETWGLSVNEAMNFNLRVVVSRICGCSEDLVRTGMGGYSITEGKVDELTKKLEDALVSTENCQSTEIIRSYSFESIAETLRGVMKETEGLEFNDLQT